MEHIATISWAKIVEAAGEAGFDVDQDAKDSGLTGESARDEDIYNEEYPVGEIIEMLFEKLGIKVVFDS